MREAAVGNALALYTRGEGDTIELSPKPRRGVGGTLAMNIERN